MQNYSISSSIEFTIVIGREGLALYKSFRDTFLYEANLFLTNLTLILLLFRKHRWTSIKFFYYMPHLFTVFATKAWRTAALVATWCVRTSAPINTGRLPTLVLVGGTCGARVSCTKHRKLSFFALSRVLHKLM